MCREIASLFNCVHRLAHNQYIITHMCEFSWYGCAAYQCWPAVDSNSNVMAHGDAREGKWKGNWRMQCVASTLHTTSEHGVSSITTADVHTSAVSSRLNWRPPADLNAVCSQYPSHYLGTWCIQHYYRWCAHLGCQQSTELTPTGRFKCSR